LGTSWSGQWTEEKGWESGKVLNLTPNL